LRVYLAQSIVVLSIANWAAKAPCRGTRTVWFELVAVAEEVDIAPSHVNLGYLISSCRGSKNVSKRLNLFARLVFSQFRSTEMRTSADLPLVSCQLDFSDGVADIESFRAAAAVAGWTRDEFNVAVVRAVYASSDFDNVGQLLYRYCTGERTTSMSADGRASTGLLTVATA
jgi:hypothetical protein